jgi:hypothetical protein
MNHRLGEEGMNMVGNNMMEVDDMGTMQEHFHSMNHGPEVESMDTVDTGMGEDRAAELEVVEREPEDVVLATGAELRRGQTGLCPPLVGLFLRLINSNMHV